MDYFSDESLGMYDVYAGFWKRFGAVLIDGFILSIPLYSIPTNQYSVRGPLIELFWEIILIAFLTIFFHYKFGATIGKMAMGIKLTQLDGSKIAFRHAFLRSSVELAFCVIFVICELYVISKIDISYLNSLPETDRMTYKDSFLTSWYDILVPVLLAWYFGEIIFVLFNRRKRALHDFIAGTIVINKRFVQTK